LRNLTENKVIIACGSLKAELERFGPHQDNIRMHYMSQNLHRYPDKMREELQERIDSFNEKGNTIVLGYGLCSNGVSGLLAGKNGIYIPRVHDCISLYLGGAERYHAHFSRRPGTYYLTQNWIENQKDPLGLLENEYTQRVGAEMAKEAIEWELKNYKYICYIDPGSEDPSPYRERAKENARVLGKKYFEVKGNDNFFRRILYGPYSRKYFVYIEPEQTSNYKNFFKQEN